MKRVIGLTMVLLAGLALLGAQTFKDGLYFAKSDDFSKSGWKEQVLVTVKGGKIAAVNWNGSNNLGVPDKKSWAASGGYGMAKAAKQGEWHLQAAKAEDFVVKNNGTDKIVLKADGATDAIAGASIHVNEFVALVKKALAGPAVPKGIYKKDGWYRAEAADFDPNAGWKDNVLVTVVNGTIVDVVWNGKHKDDSKKSKLVESLAGTYGMEKTAKQGAWHLQAAKVQDYLLKVQDPAKVAVKDGKTDAIAGASLTVGGFLSLVDQALKPAR